MHLHFPLRTLAQVAVSACLLAGTAHAQPVPAQPGPGGNGPAGMVFQGTWHDGRWDGQWVPAYQGGPGGPGGMMQPGAYPPPHATDARTQHMLDKCHRYDNDGHGWHGHDCDRFYRDHPEFAPGYAAQGAYAPRPPYGAPMGAYGQMPYGGAPMGYMMVPVMQPAPAPYTETKTVTTTYVTDRVVHHYRVVHVRHPHDKRVYTGS